MKDNTKKGFLSFNSKNFKLWIMLALIPVTIVVVVLLFGNSFFDGSAYREDDVTLSGDMKEENYEIKEEKPDIAIHQTGKIALQQTPSESASTATKADATESTSKDASKTDTVKKNKKLTDAKGNVETVTLQAGQTLQTLAQNKFGNKAFWVYYFDVNSDKLSNPNSLREGMKLAVPNPDYYGFSASDKNSVQKAKNRAAEILNAKQ